MSKATEPIRIGLLGCGTVGGGVLRLLAEHADTFRSRVGAPLSVERVLVRDTGKPRVEACDSAWVTTDPSTILEDPSIDIVVELMGGEEPAHGYLRRAIEGRKSVVTANKLLLARHGPKIIDLASATGVDLAFEASVGGGIPIIRTLREALAGDSIESIYGIVNGTCNYVLSRMHEEGLPFAEALREAQREGYAEADPSLDIDGLDAAHKIAVLAMLAFGTHIDLERIPTEGIRPIEAIDHLFAERFGFVIKHLAIGLDREGSVELRVHPALVPQESLLAHVGSAKNAIFLEGRALGPSLLSGQGAGAMPTAVSVVADIVDLAQRRRTGSNGLSMRSLRLGEKPLLPLGEIRSRYYLRFTVHDRPGVLAQIAGQLGEEGISIEQMIQDGQASASSGPVSIVLITHEAREESMSRALENLASSESIAAPTRLLRIEEP